MFRHDDSPPDPFMLTPLSPKSTGLRWLIYAAVGHADETLPYFVVANVKDLAGPRYKFYLDNGSIRDANGSGMTLIAEGKVPVGGLYLTYDDCIEVGRWRYLNKEPLLAHWEGLIDSIELCKALKPLD